MSIENGLSGGDCLYDQLVNAANRSELAVEVLSSRMTDKRGTYGQLVCEVSGCSVACVARDEGYTISLVDNPDNLTKNCLTRNT